METLEYSISLYSTDYSSNVAETSNNFLTINPNYTSEKYNISILAKDTKFNHEDSNLTFSFEELLPPVVERPDITSDIPSSMVIVLPTDFNDIRDNIEDFSNQIRDDIASTLDISETHRIVIDDIVEGSIIVYFRIEPIETENNTPLQLGVELIERVIRNEGVGLLQLSNVDNVDFTDSNIILEDEAYIKMGSTSLYSLDLSTIATGINIDYEITCNDLQNARIDSNNNLLITNMFSGENYDIKINIGNLSQSFTWIAHVEENQRLDYNNIFKLPKNLELTNIPKNYDLSKYFISYVEDVNIIYEIS